MTGTYGTIYHVTDIPVKVDEAKAPGLTIDEVARRVDMSVRNLREWRALGLLPPPKMQGRVGYYDESQVERLKRIRQLHSQGFPLDLIRRLLDVGAEAGDVLTSFVGDLRAPFREERPPIADLAELARRWGVDDPLPLLERAVALGLIRQRPDGQYEFTNARVAQVGDALQDLGLSAEQTLAATSEVRAHLDGIAEVFHRVWLEHVWQPFVDAGLPRERWSDIRRTLAHVQPVAMEAVIGLFSVAMEAEIEAGIGREVEKVERRMQANGPFAPREPRLQPSTKIR